MEVPNTGSVMGLKYAGFETKGSICTSAIATELERNTTQASKDQRTGMGYLLNIA
jgi:hypothetical protein